MKKMIVKFYPDGRVEIETKGFAGKSCVDFSAPFEKLLGRKVEERKKAEYYQRKTVENETEVRR